MHKIEIINLYQNHITTKDLIGTHATEKTEGKKFNLPSESREFAQTDISILYVLNVGLVISLM